MRAWLESIAGPQYASAMIWTLGALILLLVILVVIRIVRGLTFGTFVAGGRNRKTRLAVMDAAAVDSHRRLVLVRRDDIEHLLLIGGPTDVVVEQNIRLTTPMRRPEPRERSAADDFPARQAPESLKHPATAAEPPPPPEPARRPVEQPARPQPASPTIATPSPASATPPRAPAYSPPPRPVAPPARPATPAPAPAAGPAAVSASPATPAPSGPTESPAAPASGKSGELDDALLKELEVTLNEKTPTVDPAAKAPQEDDEMSRLLGDLSAHRDR